jgi:hypothetical protein
MAAAIRPADIAKLMKAMAVDVREFVHGELAPVLAKQSELQERVAELEQQLAATKGRDDE